MSSRIKKFLDEDDKEGLKDYMGTYFGKYALDHEDQEFNKVFDMMKHISKNDYVDIDRMFHDFMKKQANGDFDEGKMPDDIKEMMAKYKGKVIGVGKREGFMLFTIKDSGVQIEGSVGSHNALQLIGALKTAIKDIRKSIKKELGEE